MKNISLFLSKRLYGYTLVVNKFIVLERTAFDKVLCHVRLDETYSEEISTVDDIRRFVRRCFVIAGNNFDYMIKEANEI